MDKKQIEENSQSDKEEQLKASHEATNVPSTPEVEDFAEDIRMGDAKVPRFLVITYSLLIIWAFGYLLMAVPLNQVAEVAADGETIFSQSCFGCHNVTNEHKIGPGLQNVSGRYTEEEIQKILLNGIGTMPSLPNLGLNTEQIKAVKEYILSL
jgi:mono/diheme cytochrome c family protein